MGKMLLALSPMIFVMVGYAVGHHAGYDAAKVQYENYSLAHDEALKDMGVCLWAEAVARKIECTSRSALEEHNGKPGGTS